MESAAAGRSRATPSRALRSRRSRWPRAGAIELPDGRRGGLDAEAVYDPPNLTFPFGAYVCVVDVDPGTADVKVRRFIAVDDCGMRINPMIVEGQIHGGLTDGVGMALMEMIAFDEDGNCLGGSLMDYLIPTAVEVPDWETGFTVTPSPHHPIGAKGIGESATVGSPPAIVNAICDALEPYGVRHVDMPCTPSRVWDAMQEGEATAMIKGDLVQRAGAAARRRACRSCTRPSCARRKPTSVRPGDSALVLADGTIEGFVGGVCAQASVRLHAAARAGDRRGACCCGSCPARGAGRSDPIARTASSSSHNPCLSGGALEIFLEPQLPAPRIVVVGDTPIARALERRRAARPATTSSRGGAVEPQPADAALVVASHGERRGGRARAGARAPASATSALVASPRRGAAVLAALDVPDALRDQRPHARRAGHRRAHAGGDRDLDPRRDRRRAHAPPRPRHPRRRHGSRPADRSRLRHGGRSSPTRRSTSTSTASASTSAARAAARRTPRDRWAMPAS